MVHHTSYVIHLMTMPRGGCSAVTWDTGLSDGPRWESSDISVLVHTDPLRVDALNSASGAGPSLGGIGLQGTGGASLDWCISYRVAADVLGSYAGLGPNPRWFSFTTAEVVGVEDDTLVLALSGSEDPLRRSGLLKLHPAGTRLDLQVSIEPSVAVAEIAFRFERPPGMTFFGFGERFDRWDHSGTVVDGWTEDSPYHDDTEHRWTYWPLPYTVTGSGWGFVIHTDARSAFRLGTDDPGTWSASAAGTALSATVLLESAPRKVVEAFTAQYGRPPVPPSWGLGVWKTMLGGTDRVLAELGRMEDEGLPVQAIWMYDQSEPSTNSGWGSAMGYPEGNYEDIPGLVDHLHRRGYKVLGYVNPQFLTHSLHFAEGVNKQYFLRYPSGRTYILPCPDPGRTGDGAATGAGALLDVSNPAAISWWSEMLTTLLRNVGYDGWMHDFGEFTPSDAVTAAGEPGSQVRNHYPVAYQRAAADVMAHHKPDAVLFMRSGYLGSTALCPAAWPGDQHTEWDTARGLRGAIRAALSLSLAGVNTFGPDIGGFFGTDDPEHNEASAELWVRWCQFGALCPVMRDHLGHKRRPGVEPVDLWHNAQTMDTWRRYAQLHLALLPYLQGLALEAHRTGIASIRPLLLEFPDDPVARLVDDQYMLGAALLVAPVYKPGARTRATYLPDGVWYSLYGGDPISGPTWHEAEAPLDRIPVFVRAGAALPVTSPSRVSQVPGAEQSPSTAVEGHWYPLRGHKCAPTMLPDGTVLRPVDSALGPGLSIERAPESTVDTVIVHVRADVGTPRLRVSSPSDRRDTAMYPTAPTHWWSSPGWAANVALGGDSSTVVSIAGSK